MRRKAFVGSSEDILQSVILAFPSATEDQPIPVGLDPNHFVSIEDVPESLEDEELRLAELLDQGELEPETFDSVGIPPKFRFPNFVKEVHRIIHPESANKVKAACFDATLGRLIYVY